MTADKRAERIHPLSVCPMCEGEGYVLANASIQSESFRAELVMCPDCDGTGERKAR
jgi:DnaJ-class molecular chaperone